MATAAAMNNNIGHHITVHYEELIEKGAIPLLNHISNVTGLSLTCDITTTTTTRQPTKSGEDPMKKLYLDPECVEYMNDFYLDKADFWNVEALIGYNKPFEMDEIIPPIRNKEVAHHLDGSFWQERNNESSFYFIVNSNNDNNDNNATTTTRDANGFEEEMEKDDE
eukprot:CAMPEP_0194037730 /NCGR_PEP_ID=MMETSP0009_2-20130614/10053_1 /TAXON_ID=210454 /ORGANISM="Grammatophora oceanica, Strain CCMP 410" /LENGTH=165 /DNA_ID=CAMNT_0038679993 /DNA_START=27 /DNA_END=524 /DNA_ORIENTATION=-